MKNIFSNIDIEGEGRRSTNIEVGGGGVINFVPLPSESLINHFSHNGFNKDGYDEHLTRMASSTNVELEDVG